MVIGISLGWNCSAASDGVHLGLRKRKIDGYQTCPFDEALTNYKGVVECIRTDFESFFDLTLKDVAFSSPYCAGDTLVYNPTYKFLFNHESPRHADLWKTQGWKGGPTHYIANDYLLFRERYARRIEAFRNYLSGDTPVQFLITRPHRDLRDLHEVLQERYPDLTYSIHRFDLDPSLGMEHYRAHLRMMEADE